MFWIQSVDVEVTLLISQLIQYEILEKLVTCVVDTLSVPVVVLGEFPKWVDWNKWWNFRVRDPSLSLSHYISTLLPDCDLNSWVNPDPQLKV